MAVRDLNAAAMGNMQNLVDDYSVATAVLDSAGGTMGYEWQNTRWTQYLGYYKTIPELGSTIDTKAMWTAGKGYKADVKTKKLLDDFRGWGKDTFNAIMDNCVRMYNIGGDAFCEIIREKTIFNTIRTWAGLVKKGKPVNLKPLDPGRMKIVVNKAGMVLRYEYNNGSATPTTYAPEDIFHLAWNRLGDEIHGISIIQKIENIILMRNEAMSDMKTVFHRYVKPLWIWSLDTDDATKIAAFQAKADAIINTGNNIYVPKGAVEAERVSVPQYSTLDPLPWIENLTSYFYQATNIPDVILGSAKQTTEASAKILYLAFQQSIEKNQLFLEENLRAQLGLEVNFEFPASIEADLIKDTKKDGAVNIDKKETQVNLRGNK